MWRNILADEGRNIAKQAEKAHEAGDYSHARELYLKAATKFRNAVEITEDFNEIGILRTLENSMKISAQKLDAEIRFASTDKLQIIAAKAEEPKTSVNDIKEFLEGTGISEQVFEAVLNVAREIGIEGREGHAIGTAFIVGDSENVMAKSRQLVLNPFEGHRREKRLITDPENRGNLKEFAQLDGVFVISGDGAVEAGGRYITIDTAMVKIARGLGTRHSSVAAITAVTRAIGVVVSQSGGVIRVFKDGKMAATVKP
ncbi:MAG: diadenylate cyclase [Candidatus Methanoperedens sp.]|nr:diadenylate cyclase [Candidatus Methanoperedens sp.]MCZ7370533.1 diadenylate cyclase [Candidatus Methanoperedens sp.]